MRRANALFTFTGFTLTTTRTVRYQRKKGYLQVCRIAAVQCKPSEGPQGYTIQKPVVKEKRPAYQKPVVKEKRPAYIVAVSIAR
ncbi:hypothetical protein EDC01DRAFT_489661 [Geopyxis carbonaria]|nr:hypothetical protein EDC01DRAFT_489661 [Geopyxis carbonaria]